MRLKKKEKSVRRSHEPPNGTTYITDTMNGSEWPTPSWSSGREDSNRIFTALTVIAAQRLSLHSISLTLEKVPCETSFRHHLVKIDHTKNQRITLSVLPIRNGISKVSYIAHFLDVIKELGISIEVLCLDRAFFAKKVFSFLQMAKIPHIVPVRRSGKRMKEILSGRSSHRNSYTLKGKDAIQVDIVVKTIYQRGKRNKSGIKNLGYVVYGLNSTMSHCQ